MILHRFRLGTRYTLTAVYVGLLAYLKTFFDAAWMHTSKVKVYRVAQRLACLDGTYAGGGRLMFIYYSYTLYGDYWCDDVVYFGGPIENGAITDCLWIVPGTIRGY